MNRVTLLLLLVLCLAVVMNAQNASIAKEMDGTICDAGCVVQQSNLSTCDTTCNNKTGTAVFVSDSGTVMQVANQDMCKSHMNTHVKMMAQPVKSPTEDQREQWIQILSWNTPGG
jgi:hypothetical protein